MMSEACYPNFSLVNTQQRCLLPSMILRMGPECCQLFETSSPSFNNLEWSILFPPRARSISRYLYSITHSLAPSPEHPHQLHFIIPPPSSSHLHTPSHTLTQKESWPTPQFSRAWKLFSITLTQQLHAPMPIAHHHLNSTHLHQRATTRVATPLAQISTHHDPSTHRHHAMSRIRSSTFPQFTRFFTVSHRSMCPLLIDQIPPRARTHQWKESSTTGSLASRRQLPRNRAILVRGAEDYSPASLTPWNTFE